MPRGVEKHGGGDDAVFSLERNTNVYLPSGQVIYNDSEAGNYIMKSKDARDVCMSFDKSGSENMKAGLKGLCDAMQIELQQQFLQMKKEMQGMLPSSSEGAQPMLQGPQDPKSIQQ